MYLEAVRALESTVDVQDICDLIGLPRATYYSWISPPPGTKEGREYHPVHTISEQEQHFILGLMNSEEYVDLSPYEIFYHELDKGNYHCSIRSMYRILAANQQVLERRRGHQRGDYQKPELLALAPNQVWSWDITRLKGPSSWSYYYLYVILDIFSRYIVGWLLAERESSELARDLIEASCKQQGIRPDQLVIHSDNGSPMKSKSVMQLLIDLSVMRSLNRPHVSNDNPYSESQFKTLKYHPGFPDRFGSIQHGRQYVGDFVPWYNDEHYHSGLNYLTPHAVHYGYANQIVNQREEVLQRAYREYPERFKRGIPKVKYAPSKVWINKPEIKCEN